MVIGALAGYKRGKRIAIKLEVALHAPGTVASTARRRSGAAFQR
jgi:hypothetical protein